MTKVPEISFNLDQPIYQKEKKKALVTGASGFIGSHLAKQLKKEGYFVRGIDIKWPEYMMTSEIADEFMIRDLREPKECDEAFRERSGEGKYIAFDEVYALAADMGGMGFISKNHATILYNNAMINLNTIKKADSANVKKYLYTSSACVYPEYRQTKTDVKPLKEIDAYPAQPQDAYGWEKLMAEKVCEYFAQEKELNIRIVRFHNIYGPQGTYKGGREKAPAALCRKIAEAKIEGKHYIEIWGDGKATRSFCYIDDCIQGLEKIMQSDYRKPINLGRDEMVSVDQLADIIMDIAGVEFDKLYVDGPQGVRGRNSDNTLLKEVTGWQPGIDLKTGLKPTYEWIEKKVMEDSTV